MKVASSSQWTVLSDTEESEEEEEHVGGGVEEQEEGEVLEQLQKELKESQERNSFDSQNQGLCMWPQ